MSEGARLVVNRALCDGNGLCAAHAPDHLRMTEDDELELLSDAVAPAELDAVNAAIRACPKAALSLAS